MKNKYLFVTLMLCVILFVSMGGTWVYRQYSEATVSGEGKGQVLVVTSFYPMYIATSNILDGIDGIRLENLSEPQTGCLHDFQLTPEDMKLLSTADVFVVNGGGIEGFLSEVAKSYPDLMIVEACEGLELLGGDEEEEHVHEVEEEAHEVEEEDHAHEAEGEADGDHEHGEQNAHAWMSVESYREQVINIAEALWWIFPQFMNDIVQNSKRYDGQLAELQDEIWEISTTKKGQSVVLFHEAYTYVAKDYGMKVVYTMDLDEERQVSAGEVAEVISAIKENDVKLVIAEERYGKSMGDLVEKETGVRVVYLDALNRGEYTRDSYLVHMKENIRKLAAIQ